MQARKYCTAWGRIQNGNCEFASTSTVPADQDTLHIEDSSGQNALCGRRVFSQLPHIKQAYSDVEVCQKCTNTRARFLKMETA